MSNSIASDMTPAILRGGRFTTNNACLPSISRGFARSRFIPAKTVRQWSPKLTRSATNFSELETSLADSIVPTLMSIWFRSSGEIVGFALAGVTQQLYSACGKPRPAGKNAIKVQTLKCQGRENFSPHIPTPEKIDLKITIRLYSFL